MSLEREQLVQQRRSFMTSAASGIGAAALASLVSGDGLLAEDAPAHGPHHQARAKACIFIFLAGGPSQIDLFDPKPELNKRDGQKLPASLTKKVRFAFINDNARIKGSRFKFDKHGQSGMELSQLLPKIAGQADDLAIIRSMHTNVFNHLPGHILMNTGFEQFGKPSVGAWALYGLGSVSKNLPGYVVLTSQSLVRGGGANWSHGFLPPSYQGVHFRSQGDPVLNLSSPAGIPQQVQAASIDAVGRLNRLRYEQVRDKEITSRTKAYELAFRMQQAAPELTDLSKETQKTLDAYGVHRQGHQPVVATYESKRPVSRTFSLNCLLARRLVERGVRFVTIFHGDWDHHNGLDQGLRTNAAGIDQPIAFLLKDLRQRGLLDSTLVVGASEFGRTPLGQGKDGRDHHPQAFSTFMAGGGTRGGTVVGKTDQFGWGPVEDPVHVHDFHATLLHLMGLDHRRLTYRFQGRPFRLTDVAGKVVKKVLA